MLSKKRFDNKTHVFYRKLLSNSFLYDFYCWIFWHCNISAKIKSLIYKLCSFKREFQYHTMREQAKTEPTEFSFIYFFPLHFDVSFAVFVCIKCRANIVNGSVCLNENACKCWSMNVYECSKQKGKKGERERALRKICFCFHSKNTTTKKPLK